MRELTFHGFLKSYVRQLSLCGSNSLFKLAREAETSNPRLKAPLLLYALSTEKEALLLRAVKDTALRASYETVLALHNETDAFGSLESGNSELPDEYLKVWKSYQYAKNRPLADADTKELMRKKIRRLQDKASISNYKIYADLKLNAGNLNAWLKHGDGSKVSLNTARSVLNYVEAVVNNGTCS